MYSSLFFYSCLKIFMIKSEEKSYDGILFGNKKERNNATRYNVQSERSQSQETMCCTIPLI